MVETADKAAAQTRAMTSLFGTLDSPRSGWIPKGASRHVRWLGRVLWNEVFGFLPPFPIESVPEAGPRNSLHYYVYSERLFFDAMQLDQRGVPFQRSRALGDFYNPAYVAWYGLMALEQSVRMGKEPDKRFRIQVQWLLENSTRRDDQSIVWTYPVDVREGNCVLHSPWISAMSQGLAISALVRAHRLENSPQIIDVCCSALRVFNIGVNEGGVRTDQKGFILYEEYPAYPLPRVLDGFLFSLLGLYDLWVETEDATAKRRFCEGVNGLVGTIQNWDYKNCWTWYGTHGYLCPRHYHDLNRLLILALAEITGETLLHRFASAWESSRIGGFELGVLFLKFFLLKQRSRIRSRCGRASHR